MKIIAPNYAASLLRDTARVEDAADIVLHAIGCDLRSLYGDTAEDVPDALLALAQRLDRGPDASALAA